MPVQDYLQLLAIVILPKLSVSIDSERVEVMRGLQLGSRIAHTVTACILLMVALPIGFCCEILAMEQLSKTMIS
ncbi:hypothetical protein SAMN05660964_01625 [Thiothrix caldifontis]|uniref:Uncharacterized protein n=2 Tax=Thiothrix caldifontis TaxID=525918 RepID=A0A1H4BE17_9GAMM|nr:hypothetical protein SAMN05660964_01625 [Thiothrix caldifontis]